MENSWPRYTILLPLYKEKSVIDKLMRAVKSIDYPKHLLQVLVLLEEDDISTLKALSSVQLDRYFKILITPDKGPKTKARACNYGLKHATGEYLVIFDAEDIPDKDQLKLAHDAFCNSASDVACLQGKLTFFNYKENLLTRCCAIEYFMHFEVILPCFASANIPIPLGGTSNHLCVKKLREVGGWDEYNVTEDADLTYRFSNKGYRIKMLDSYTQEETVIDLMSWIKQRSRWMKGHMITFFVHSRSLFVKKSSAEQKFSLFYFLFLSPCIIFLYFFLLFISIFCQIRFQSSLVVFAMAFNTVITGIFLYRNKKLDLLPTILFYNAYLLLYLFVFVISFVELIYKPHHWQKTEHGKSKFKS